MPKPFYKIKDTMYQANNLTIARNWNKERKNN